MNRLVKLFAVALCSVLLAAGCGTDDPPTPDPVATGPTPAATPAGECSAAGMEANEFEPEGLPAEVAATRTQILQAAVDCDYATLEELGFQPNGAFQYSLEEESAGPNAQPAEFWRAQEQAGEMPMAALVDILNTAPEVQEVTEPEGPGSRSDESYYNWPPAAEAPAHDGYATTITSSGDWIYFLKRG